jgi:uncharacterized membrane protein required for colicin V production
VNVFLLLDVLLLILIALFIPIGFWRGTHRELYVTLGIFFGAALAESWAQPWGSDLASLTRLRESGGVFMVAVLFLVASTFLLGYGAGAALTVPRPGWVSRLFGAIIAGFNGALLLSFALRYIRVYLLADQSPGFLDQAVVAQFLTVNAGWLLIGAAAVCLPVVVVLALLGRGQTIPRPAGSSTTLGTSDQSTDSFALVESPAEVTAIYKSEPPVRAYENPSEQTRPLDFRSTSSSDLWGGSQRNDVTDKQAVVGQQQVSPNAQETLHIDQASSLEGNGSDGDSNVKPDASCKNCNAELEGSERFCTSCGSFLS